MGKRTLDPEQAALAALDTAQKSLIAAEESVTRARAQRDQAIRELIEQGHSVRSLALRLGLARQSIMAIRDYGSNRSAHDDSEPLF